jgi:hypothetical protein
MGGTRREKQRIAAPKAATTRKWKKAGEKAAMTRKRQRDGNVIEM